MPDRSRNVGVSESERQESPRLTGVEERLRDDHDG